MYPILHSLKNNINHDIAHLALQSLTRTACMASRTLRDVANNKHMARSATPSVSTPGEEQISMTSMICN